MKPTPIARHKLPFIARGDSASHRDPEVPYLQSGGPHDYLDLFVMENADHRRAHTRHHSLQGHVLRRMARFLKHLIQSLVQCRVIIAKQATQVVARSARVAGGDSLRRRCLHSPHAFID